PQRHRNSNINAMVSEVRLPHSSTRLRTLQPTCSYYPTEPFNGFPCLAVVFIGELAYSQSFCDFINILFGEDINNVFILVGAGHIVRTHPVPAIRLTSEQLYIRGECWTHVRRSVIAIQDNALLQGYAARVTPENASDVFGWSVHM